MPRSSAFAWKNSKTVMITFGASASVLPGDYVIIDDGVLQIADPAAVLHAYTTNTTLLEPTSPLTPTPEVLAPSTVGVCDAISLDASLSAGSGGRPLTLKWYLANNKTLQSTYGWRGRAAAGNSSRVLASATAANAVEVSLGATEVPPGVKIWVTLIATNFFGRSASTSISLLRSGLPKPSVSIGGVSPRTVTRSDTLLLRAAAAMPDTSCLTGTSFSPALSFSWRETTGQFSVTEPLNPRRLVIAPGTLSPLTTYVFEVYTQVGSNAGL